jgi:hypothetical protein
MVKSRKEGDQKPIKTDYKKNLYFVKGIRSMKIMSLNKHTKKEHVVKDTHIPREPGRLYYVKDGVVQSSTMHRF